MFARLQRPLASTHAAVKHVISYSVHSLTGYTPSSNLISEPKSLSLPATQIATMLQTECVECLTHSVTYKHKHCLTKPRIHVCENHAAFNIK